MNFRDLPDDQKRDIANLMFAPLSSSTQLKDWVRFYLNLEIPLEITDPDSNSSPLDAIWQVYETFKNNSGDVNPGYILMSCREGMKTVSVAILEMLLMIHFQLEIAHAAATEAQSSVGIKYIEGFMMQIEPLVLAHGWENITQNKRTIQFRTPENKTPFIKIIICNPKGMNSLHANVLFLDELDLADPAALKEGVNIVGYSKGIYGVKVYLSTRKYAFGNMAQAIEKAEEMNYKLVRWNLIDVTEACPPSRHLPNEPKSDRYVAKGLPLKQIPPEEFNALPEVEKPKWDLIKDAYTGCHKCPLLPVCRTRLANKSQTATGGFYKPIVSVIQKFAENDPDTAEAQLMCWKPGSAGLVYPRFNSAVGKGNVITVKQAYESLIGPTENQNITELTLLHEMQKAGILFYAGVDWGYTHDFVICIIAIIPNGEVWLMETYASPGLEFSDILEIAITYRDKYKVQKWFCDQAMPSHIKSFNKNAMKSPAFTKDVMGGIEAMRSKITNSIGKRLFKVLHTDMNKKSISAISKHRFVLDGQGNVTLTPDDATGIADICDTLRYIGQNLFPVRGPQKPAVAWLDDKGQPIDPDTPEGRAKLKEAMDMAEKASVHENQMKSEIAKHLGAASIAGSTKRKGGFMWNA